MADYEEILTEVQTPSIRRIFEMILLFVLSCNVLNLQWKLRRDGACFALS